MKKYLPIILYPLVFSAEADAATPDNQGRLQQYPNLSARDYTDVFSAAYAGDLAAVKEFIDRGVNPNAINRDGQTVFFDAVSSGNLELVKYLFEAAAAKPDVVDDDRCTALHMAALYTDNLELVKYLVEETAANLNAINRSRETVLHLGAERGILEFVKYLVEKGAKLDAVDKYNNTALIKAIFKGSLEIVKYLVDVGSNINAVPKDGMTALYTALLSKNQDLIHYLEDIVLYRTIDLQTENSGPLVSSITGFDVNELGFGRWAIESNASVSTTEYLPNQFILTFTGRLSDGNQNKDIPVKIGSKVFHIRHTAAWEEFTQQIFVNLEGKEVNVINFSGYSLHDADRSLGVMVKTLQLSRP